MSTYFVTDQRMFLHNCEWDETHIELPIRLSALTDLVQQKGLMSKCQVLKSKLVALEDLYSVHSEDYVDKIRHTETLNKEQLEEFSARYEDIYVNQYTWTAAQLSAGCAVELLENVLKNPKSNGFAAIRPPGHHASYEQPCGFCIFNNVVICAKKARKLGCKRVLILDWDIHAAQGTQYCVEEDPGIRLISIHRFQQGNFWPELAESASVQPYQNTMNIPLNEVGYGDSEYISFFHSLVLPFIEHWKPDVILVSAGYDAALGDPQGEMEVTPGGFGYMTGVLASLGIPLCLLLEGGYFIESVAYGGLYSLQALLDRKPAPIHLNLSPPAASFLYSLHSTLAIYQNIYSIFGIWIDLLNHYRKQKALTTVECPNDEYKGHREVNFPYQTRGMYKPLNQETVMAISEKLHTIMHNYRQPEQKKSKIEVNVDGDSINIYTGDATFSIGFSSITNIQYLVICFYILAPLCTAYDLYFNREKVVDASILSDVIAAFPKCRDENQLFSESLKEDLETIIDAFPQLKKFFLF